MQAISAEVASLPARKLYVSRAEGIGVSDAAAAVVTEAACSSSTQASPCQLWAPEGRPLQSPCLKGSLSWALRGGMEVQGRGEGDCAQVTFHGCF